MADTFPENTAAGKAAPDKTNPVAGLPAKPRTRKFIRLSGNPRYRLEFVNENTLMCVWSIRMSRKRIIAAIIAGAVALVSVGAMIISLTPLRTLLPGYLKGTERREYLAANARIDSLLNVVMVNDRYLNNLNAIILGEVNADSLLTAPMPDPQPLDTARLLGRSVLEAEFVKKYGAISGFSLDSLPRLLPDAPAFVTPVRDAVVSPSNQPGRLNFAFTDKRNPVYAIAAGRLIDVDGGSDEGFRVVCQHPDGFLTHYSGLSKVNYRAGQTVQSGSQLGVYVKSDSIPFGFRLFRDGVALTPTDYIIF